MKNQNTSYASEGASSSLISMLSGYFNEHIEQMYEKQKSILKNLHVWSQEGVPRLAGELAQFMNESTKHLTLVNKMVQQTEAKAAPGKSTEMSVWINDEVKQDEEPRANIETGVSSTLENRLIWDILATS